MAAFGPTIMRLAFGGNFHYPRGGLVMIAAGMGFYLSAATLNQAALAHAKARQAAVVWVITAVACLWLGITPIEAWNYQFFNGRTVPSMYAAVALLDLMYINLYWGIFNLMPIMPLMLRPNSKTELTIAFGMGSAYRASLNAGLKSTAVELVPSPRSHA